MVSVEPNVSCIHLGRVLSASASSCALSSRPVASGENGVLHPFEARGLTHPDRNTQNERRATQSNTRQRTQGKQNQRSRNNTSKPKTNTADPEHYSKPPTTENRNLRTNRKPLPSKPPPKAYLNHTVQANQTCQGPPWILPVTPVSTGRVQATSKHLTASLRVECVPGTQPHKRDLAQKTFSRILNRNTLHLLAFSIRRNFIKIASKYFRFWVKYAPLSTSTVL